MASSDFKITTEQIEQTGRKPVTVFYLRGWLDAQSEAGLYAAAQEAHTKGTRRLIINMEELSIMTSAGIRALQKVHKLFETSETDDQKTRLKLCSAPPQVYHALSVTGYLQTLPMYESMKSALTSYEM